MTLIALVLVVVPVCLLTVSHEVVVASKGYGQAIAIVSRSQQVRSVLGEDIRIREPVVGTVNNLEGEQFIQFAARLSGTRGSGRLYCVANAINNKWEFSRLLLSVDNSSQEIDLAPSPTLLELPVVPAKKIFLLPASLGSNESLDWAPTYYKAKFGVAVEVLPSVSIPATLEDHSRHQIDSELFVDWLSIQYPDIARDPTNIVIAVTSRDIFIRTFGWRYAQNFRHESRFAVISSARLRPFGFFHRRNPEWLHSRLQKMLTKNIAVLYFDLPMSSDYSSLLSGGVLSGSDIDRMSGSIVGAEGGWDPFIDSGDLNVTTWITPGKPPLWRLASTGEPTQTSTRVLQSDLTIGLFVYRKADFVFDGEFPLHFIRVYRNRDQQSRPFGIGTNDSLDIFLVGEMGKYVELILEDGGRVHFDHVFGQKYQAGWAPGSPFSHAQATYANNTWTIARSDGWKFYFPYHPQAPGAKVTVLTGFCDPSGHQYKMLRDSSGDLLSVTTPSGRQLRFEYDSQHRTRAIVDSLGGRVSYRYDDAGRLTEFSDSEGAHEIYTYDANAQMLSIRVGADPPIVVNTYDISGNITDQTLSDGGRLHYHYTPGTGNRPHTFLPDLIIAPDGLRTHVRYGRDGYTRSLPVSK